MENTIVQIFPADEGLDPQNDVDTPITVFDDDIDEADQVFIANLVISGAVNTSQVLIERRSSTCIIDDNDREYLFTTP